MNEAGQVKIPWWKAGTGEWPSEAARVRGERVAVEYTAFMALYREMCPGCALVEPFPYWRDWFAEARTVALALALAPVSPTPEEDREHWSARRRALMDELLAWDIEEGFYGRLSLNGILPELPKDADSYWDAAMLWVNACVDFEGMFMEAFGLWQGLLEVGKEERGGQMPSAEEIAEKTAAFFAVRFPGLGRGGPTPKERFAVTQEDVAKKLGVDARTVRKWEAGEGAPPEGYSRELRRNKADFAVFAQGQADIQDKRQRLLDAAHPVKLGNRMGLGPKRGSQ